MSSNRIYLKGLSMHSAGRAVYQLDGTYRSFEATIALDDTANGRGSASFRVFLVRGNDWEEAFNSNIVRGGDQPQAVSVELGDARGLALLVDYADRGDELDHASWLDARLVK